MKSASQINFTENPRLLDGVAEVIEVWQVVGVLDSDVIDQAEVPARSLRAIRLSLQVEGGTVVMSFSRVNPFHYS